MSHTTASDQTGRESVVRWIAGLDGVRLDTGVMAFAIVGLVGNLLDIRHHAAGHTFEEEGFLTVPHGIFYAAFGVVAVLIASVLVARRLEGRTWRESIPEGYALGLVGVVLFGLGGPADAAWHATFSAESGVEGLTSPTHLMIATGAVLFLSSPVRRAVGQTDLRGRRQVPMLLSAAFTFTAITIITVYGNPTADTDLVRTGEMVRLGVVMVLFQAGLLAGVVAMLARRFRLVPGAFTLVLGLNGIAMTWIGETYVLLPGILLTGVVADVAYALLRPTPSRERVFRGFIVGVPVLYYAAYFVTIALTGGIAWIVHIWAGAIILAGFAGLLVSYVALPGEATRANFD